VGLPNAKYVRRADDTGWLVVLLSANRQRAALCEYTKVLPLREANGRTYFRILDGNSGFAGQEASLFTSNAEKFLSESGPKPAAEVRVAYSGAPANEVSPFKGPLLQQWAKLTFGSQQAVITLNSVWNASFTPIPAGTHRIMAPDQSHANISTQGYRQATPGLRCTDVWFPIQLAGTRGPSSRYVHVGHLSEGCVTVHELARWTALYDYLISRRVDGENGQFIGTLVVTK